MEDESWKIADAGTGTRLYGVMAEFATPEALSYAAAALRMAGYSRLDAFSPFPIEGLGETLGARKSGTALWTLLGGIAGLLTAYVMQWYSAVVSYPINVGGRPYHSVPAFIPVCFELTVLFASVGAVLSIFFQSGLPKPYHPVFNVEAFRRSSQDRFFLCIEAADERFDRTKTWRLLESLGGESVYDVDA